MKSVLRIVSCLLCLMFVQATCVAAQDSAATQVADYVFKNGKIYTLDAKQLWVESVAVKGSKISYVGSNSGSKVWTGPETKVVDLKGRMLMPGFIDGHNHFVSGTATKRGVNLTGSKDKQELLLRIREYVKANPRKTAYMGFGWEFAMLGEKGGLRQELDAICSDKAMIFLNEDTHHIWFNTKAMTVGGVTKDTPDPVPGGSYFRRDQDGTPSGMAIEPDSWMPMAIKAGILGGREMLQGHCGRHDAPAPEARHHGLSRHGDMGAGYAQWLPRPGTAPRS